MNFWYKQLRIGIHTCIGPLLSYPKEGSMSAAAAAVAALISEKLIIILILDQFCYLYVILN
jgi:hypothetical protein